jgi:hypothetical protein
MDNPKQQLRDDIRRCAGLMESVVERAQQLDMLAPEPVTTCVDLWRGWVRSLDRRRGRPRDDHDA